MKLKIKIFTYVVSLLILFSPLLADKKVPPIPLSDLTNPGSPSYVPYPYPKTEFEIFEDFKYAIGIHFGARKEKLRSVLSAYKDDVNRQQIILGLLGDNPSLKIIDIIKVQDLIPTSPSRYIYLLPIADNNGEVVAFGQLNDSGLLGGVAFFSQEVKFKPFRTEKQLEKILTQALGDIGINRMERIRIHSTISTPGMPIWKISTSRGVFFVDYDDNIYAIESETFWTTKVNYPDPEHKKALILDPLNDRVIFLRKIGQK